MKPREVAHLRSATGGVLTILPNAIMEDPFGVYKVIQEANEHPLWVCYIHPFVLGVLVNVDYPDHDPVTLSERYAFCCTFISLAYPIVQRLVPISSIPPF